MNRDEMIEAVDDLRKDVMQYVSKRLNRLEAPDVEEIEERVAKRFNLGGHDPTRDVLLVLAGLGVGVLLMYIFDPVGGPRRRSLARDKVTHWAHVADEALEDGGQQLRQRVQGVAAQARSRMGGASNGEGLG